MKAKTNKRLVQAAWMIGIAAVVIGFFYLLVNGGRRLDKGWQKELSFLIRLLLVYLSVFVTMLLHIALHELGHVIFGVLTGYQFFSYRFLSFGICKRNGRWKLFRMHIPGTAGQALLGPPVVKEGEKPPYFWYNFGGVFVNLLLTFVFLLIAYCTSNYTVYSWCAMGAIMGLALALMNGIPYSEKGMTDGCNIVQFTKHPERIQAFLMQLKVLVELCNGKTWKEYEPSDFITEEGPDSTFGVGCRIWKMNCYYARGEFERANEVLSEMIPYKEQMLDVYKNVITLEQIFQELIGVNDPEKIKGLYSKKLGKFVKAMKYEPSVWRVEMAYAWFHNEDQVAAMMCYEEIKKLRNKVISPADVELELSLGDYIKERMEQTEILHLE